MLQKKQEEAALLAASKRIVNKDREHAEEATGIPIDADDMRRNFVLSASGYRRSRGKTAPMITPIEDVEKFIRENQEDQHDDTSNVRRTVSTSLFRFPGHPLIVFNDSW